MRWQVIIPVKSPPNAKTRLFDPTFGSALHDRLVRAIQRDTLEAVAAARESTTTEGVHIEAITVVGDLEPFPAHFDQVPDVEGGLNAAITHVAGMLMQAHPDDGIAVVVADLPALRAHDLLAVLHEAGRHPRAFVRDWQGTGTTMLTANIGCEPVPHFGLNSAELHLASGAADLLAPDSARSDVDTDEDLRRCRAIGLGPHTTRLLDDELAGLPESLTRARHH